MNGGKNLQVAQEPREYSDFKHSVYDDMEKPLEADQGEFDRDLYKAYEREMNLRRSQDDDEIEGPIVSPFPFRKNDAPRLSASYDDVFDNVETKGRSGSDNSDREYAEYMKRLYGIDLDESIWVGLFDHNMVCLIWLNIWNMSKLWNEISI